jgi:hypothetical protein
MRKRVITVQPTNRITDWAPAQDVDSTVAGFASSKKRIASQRVPNFLHAQAKTGLGVFIERHIRNAKALLSDLSQGFGSAAVHNGNVPAVLY